MKIRFIKSNEKREIVAQLEQQFGIQQLPYLLLESGKEKIRGFSGHLSKDEISKLSGIANIEIVGLYLLRKEHDLRLSFDATQILSAHLTKNILSINELQFKDWIKGYDIDIKFPQGIYVIKYNEDILGCGKSTGNKILNHVPKDRRLRK